MAVAESKALLKVGVRCTSVVTFELVGTARSVSTSEEQKEQRLSLQRLRKFGRQYLPQLRGTIITVLPNFEAAIILLSSVTAGALIPFSPSTPRTELCSACERLRPQTCISVSSFEIVLAACTSCDVPVISMELATHKILLERWQQPNAASDRHVELPSKSLVLHTSGSTGKQKLVAIKDEVLRKGGELIAGSLQLRETDVCVNAMPLYHIGGIVCNLFSVLSSGGKVVCAQWSDSRSFLDHCHHHSASWYYASPTIHNLVVSYIKLCPMTERIRLRLVRSGAAALLPSLATEMENILCDQVLPTYSMTECMPIASTKLSYRVQSKPGTVGCGLGATIRLKAGSNWCRTSECGEVCISSPLISPYVLLDSNDAGEKSEWMQTGDLGHLDSSNDLFLTGRIKEVINRGGEIISPFEIEDAIRRASERVKDVVAFGVPDEVFGEAVGVMIVAAGDDAISKIENELCERLKVYLSQSKVPTKYLVTKDELPRGRTGKIDRRKARELLRDAHLPSKNHANEADLLRLLHKYCKTLKTDSLLDEVMMNSTQISRVLNDIYTIFGIELSLVSWYESVDVNALWTTISRHMKEREGKSSAKAAQQANTTVPKLRRTPFTAIAESLWYVMMTANAFYFNLSSFAIGAFCSLFNAGCKSIFFQNEYLSLSRCCSVLPKEIAFKMKENLKDKMVQSNFFSLYLMSRDKGACRLWRDITLPVFTFGDVSIIISFHFIIVLSDMFYAHVGDHRIFDRYTHLEVYKYLRGTTSSLVLRTPESRLLNLYPRAANQPDHCRVIPNSARQIAVEDAAFISKALDVAREQNKNKTAYFEWIYPGQYCVPGGYKLKVAHRVKSQIETADIQENSMNNIGTDTLLCNSHLLFEAAERENSLENIPFDELYKWTRFGSGCNGLILFSIISIFTIIRLPFYAKPIAVLV